MEHPQENSCEGILLLDKPVGKTSFHLVATLRKKLGVRKIGHAGTLDPFATGVMVMLVGRNFTKLSDSFLHHDKEYVAKAKLGVATDTYDCEGEVIATSELIPSLDEVKVALEKFQGEIQQIPPMYSAKKVNGQKLYDLARKGQVIERAPVTLTVETEMLAYEYPYLTLRIKCSKGTYIRSIAHDLGQLLGCGAHLVELIRTRSGHFAVENCLAWDSLQTADKDTLAKRFLN